MLRLASDVIASFEGRRFTNPELGAEVRAMREEIDWMLSFDFLGDVGPMQLVPSQSSVLQRREGYREFLGHFIRISQASVLAEDRDRWHALLDLKDGALLYELWCFFEVKRALDALLGPPGSASLVATEEERRKVPWSAVGGLGDPQEYDHDDPRRIDRRARRKMTTAPAGICPRGAAGI